MKSLLALAVCLLLGGCGEPVVCGGSPPPVYVDVVTDTPLAPGTLVTVCFGRAGCTTATAGHDGTLTSVALPGRADARTFDGLLATARSGTRVGHAPLRFHDVGDGPCTSSYTTATVRLGPGKADVAQSP